MDTKKLRQKILDLAIHGKLVPQDPNDEPASVLLGRIRAEKEQLIKEGKIKAPKKSKSAGDTSHYPKEGPWKLPKGWCWTKLGEISDYGKCVTVPVSAIQDDEWVLELEDIEKDTGRILKQITKKERPINGSRHAFTKNQILYSKLRTYLNKVLIAPNNGYCTTEIIPISPQSGILPEYLNLVLRSPYFQEYTAQCGYGVKMPRLGTSDAIKSLIPVPPYGEQQRIIESANKLADITERIQSEKEHLSEHITGCKSRILELAIYGKLVPQDPAEEPAIELLKRINPSFETSDNLHYDDIPNNWVECALSDVCTEFIVPQRDKPKKFDGDIPWCRIEDIEGKYLNGSRSNRLVSRETIAEMNMRICPVGTVICSCSASIGTQAIVTKPCCTNQTFIGLVCNPKLIHNEYLYYFLSSQKEKFLEIGTGTTIKYISREKFEGYHIPLPPLLEQEHIVERIDFFNSILDGINRSLAP